MDTILYGYRFFDDLLIQDWPIFPFCFSIDVKIQPFIVLQYSSSVILPMMCLLFMCTYCVLCHCHFLLPCFNCLPPMPNSSIKVLGDVFEKCPFYYFYRWSSMTKYEVTNSFNIRFSPSVCSSRFPVLRSPSVRCVYHQRQRRRVQM